MAGAAIVVLCAAAFGWGCAPSSTVEYTSEAGGYSLSYPGEWTKTTLSQDPSALDLKFDEGAVSINRFGDPDSQMNLDKARDVLMEMLNRPDGEVKYSNVTESKTTVAGQPALKVTSDCSAAPDLAWRKTSVLVEDAGRLYVFQYEAKPGSYENNMGGFEELLDSVRFTSE